MTEWCPSEIFLSPNEESFHKKTIPNRQGIFPSVQRPLNEDIQETDTIWTVATCVTKFDDFFCLDKFFKNNSETEECLE